jgi:hypothetical protein
MDSIQDKSLLKSRALLFGLLVSCNIYEGASANCPLSEIRNNASDEEKYKYVMGLSDEEINIILAYHNECFEKRMSGVTQ